MSGKDMTPLETLESFEAAAFRISGVARRLLARAGHAGLPVQSLAPAAHSFRHTAGKARLRLDPGTREGVRAWAEALGTEVTARFYEAVPDASSYLGQTFVYLKARADIDGVEVSVEDSYTPSDEEIEGWRSDPRPEPGAAGGAVSDG